jgi:antitoxin component YwqK of YwqJK toxin-antitoxin module
MKEKIIQISALFILTISSAGQKIDTVYYNAQWDVTTKDNFKYYRLFTNIGDTIKVTDYYKNGTIQMTGGYKEREFINPIGMFIYYDRKRNKTQIEIFEPSKHPEICSKYIPIPENIGSKADSIILFVAFYNNKNIKCFGYELNKSNRIGQWVFKDRKGRIMMIESYQDNRLEGPYRCYYSNILFISGQYINNKKDGEWSLYHSVNGSLVKKVIFKDGKRIRTIR